MSEFENVTAPPPPPTSGSPSAEERQWALFAHLSALVGGILTSGWAGSLGCFIGPLIIWLVKKDTMPFVNDQGKEALNFNITVGIIFLALFLLTIVTLGIGALITLPLIVNRRHRLAGVHHHRRDQGQQRRSLSLSADAASDQVSEVRESTKKAR